MNSDLENIGKTSGNHRSWLHLINVNSFLEGEGEKLSTAIEDSKPFERYPIGD